MNKFLQKVLLTGLLLVSQALYALPFNVFPTPNTFFPNQVLAGQSIRAYYTVQNNTVSVRSNNFVKYLPPGVTQITQNNRFPNACHKLFNLQPHGKAGDSCILELLVPGPVNGNDPDPHHHLFVCFPGGTTCAGTNSPLNVATTTSNAIFVGGGVLQLPALKALLVSSQDGGLTWTNQSKFPGSNMGQLFTADCTGTGLDAICVAAGANFNNAGPALIMVSQNGGLTWQNNNMFAGFSPQSASCTGSGSTAICSVVGQNNAGQLPPEIIVSQDGGTSFAVAPLTNSPNCGVFTAIRCIGSGSAALCVAVGNDCSTAPPIVPLIYTSHDGGSTWTPVIQGLPMTESFYGVDCAGNGDTNTLCVAVGGNANNPSKPPLLSLSHDGGNTWTSPSIPGLPASGYLNSVSCIGSGNSARCAAGGIENETTPFLMTTQNGGNTWNVLTFPQFAGVINQVSCTGEGPTGICVAVGTGEPLILLVSQDGGVTWQPVSGAATRLEAAHCQGSGSTAICTALGQEGGGQQKALALVSRNGGLDWSTAQIADITPFSVFIGNGGTKLATSK